MTARPQPPSRSALRAAWRRHLARLGRLVEQNGWAVQHVIGDERTPSVAYTIGLSRIPHPELYICGVAPDVGGEICDDLARQVRAGRRRFQAGEQINGLVDDAYTLTLIAITDPATHLRAAYAWHGKAVTALQLVWPDPNNRLPWEPGFDPRFAVFQPLLGGPPSTPPPGT